MSNPGQLINVPHNPIKMATDYQSAIEIIPEDLCRTAIEAMQTEFLKRFPDSNQITIVPIMRGGNVIGKVLSQTANIATNPMRMAYYDKDNIRLPKPICLASPDFDTIVNDSYTRQVVFTEAVVESQATLLAAIAHINSMLRQLYPGAALPKYHTYALVTKTGDREIHVPKLRAMFAVHPDIWIHGWGCDNAGQGRECRSIMGILSPLAKTVPKEPYFECLF